MSKGNLKNNKKMSINISYNNIILYASKVGDTIILINNIKQAALSERVWLLICTKTSRQIKTNSKYPKVGDIVSKSNGKRFKIIFCKRY